MRVIKRTNVFGITALKSDVSPRNLGIFQSFLERIKLILELLHHNSKVLKQPLRVVRTTLKNTSVRAPKLPAVATCPPQRPHMA